MHPALIPDVAEQGQGVAAGDDGFAVGVGVDGVVTGDVIENGLADGRVVADEDEDGGRAAVGPGLLVGFPLGKLAGVVAIKALEGPFEEAGQERRGLGLFLTSTQVSQPVADMDPEVAILGIFAGHRVIGDGDPGNLDDPGLDGVHEREVGNDPGEQGPFGIARAFEIERRGGQVINRLHADFPMDRLQPGDPHPSILCWCSSRRPLPPWSASPSPWTRSFDSSGGPRR